MVIIINSNNNFITVKSHLRYMMDLPLLKKFKLITPDDFISPEYQSTQPPQGIFIH